ncbi:type II secretion system protein [Massilia arenosa]|uniref:Type II secretion system protein n=1 Tax=Zemynaea arenosa TaxID=2561931 RepID=A0A4Y9S9V9_9BURK|nr:type II secretion system protein [Massilia arenosa]TFW17321.1 type II secretion system protein [Massilia arenosa]
MKQARCRGFTLLELAVCLCVFLILLGVLGNRLLFYRMQAERVQVQQTVSNMRTGLYARAGLAQNAGDLERLANMNPLSFLDRIPTNYIGEYYSPDIEKLPRGVWLYDKSDRSLVYLLNHRNFFSDGNPNLLKFKVKFLRLPQNNAKPSDAPGINAGVVLTQVDVTS